MLSICNKVVYKPGYKVSKLLKSIDPIKPPPLPFVKSISCIKPSSRNSMTSNDSSTTASSPIKKPLSFTPDPVNTNSGVGHLELIIGPMFSGKTTELMKQMDNHERWGLKVLAIKSSIDTRYAKIKDNKSYIVTHSGGKRNCLAVSTLDMIEKDFAEEYESAEVIAIDEGQFFTDLDSFCRKAVDRHHKIVYVAGLDGDFLRKPFIMAPKRSSAILQLIPFADSVKKQLAQCHYCKAPAPFTLRTIPEKSEVLVGGADSYVPVCRHHYLIKWKEIQSKST
eukprot:g168.t1